MGKVYRPWTVRIVEVDSLMKKLRYFDGDTLKGIINLSIYLSITF
jgi:hypothetical protein